MCVSIITIQCLVQISLLYAGSANNRYTNLQKILPASYLFISSKWPTNYFFPGSSGINYVIMISCNTVYIIEIILRIIGVGPFEYFKKKRNM